MSDLSSHPILERSRNNLILDVSATEVGKVILPLNLIFTNGATGEVIPNPFPQPTVEDEAVLLQYANKINGLLPKFIRMDKWVSAEGEEHSMLVMERLTSLPLDHFDLATRTLMLQRFSEQLTELHKGDFVHGDLVRLTSIYTRGDVRWMMGNLLQTETELRLLDTGCSFTWSREESSKFYGILVREKEDLAQIHKIYLHEDLTKLFADSEAYTAKFLAELRS